MARSPQKKEEAPNNFSFPPWLSVGLALVGFIATGASFYYSKVVMPKMAADVVKQQAVVELSSRQSTGASMTSLVNNCVFLQGTDGTHFSEQQQVAIKNIVYALEQRNDLVLVVVGYTNENPKIDQFTNAARSSRSAMAMKDVVVSFGISSQRVFCSGYGSNVPLSFPKDKGDNLGLMLVDLYALMKNSVNKSNSIAV